MAFTISGTQVQVSGNETGLSFRTWVGSNPTAGKQLTANTVEALFQLKIQNGAVFDTSAICLVTNHKVEGQDNNNPTDTGIWKCFGGMIIVKGSTSEWSNSGAIINWDGVQILVSKTNGYYAPWNGGSMSGYVKNTNIYVKSTPLGIDGALSIANGNGTLLNVSFINESGNPGNGYGLVAQDTDGWYQKNIPFLHFAGNAGFHKNLRFFNTSGEIEINYRRNCGGAVFYNPVNVNTGNKASGIRYMSLGTSTTDASRSVVVGAYAPQIINSSGVAVSNVYFAIYKTSDNALECKGTTGTDGKPYIVQGSSNTDEQSYNNTFTIAGANYQKIIRDAGVKYIKQSITPTTTGGNVVSVDQGTFKVVQRKKEMQEIVTTQSFQNDYSGQKVMFVDSYYTTDQSANTTISINSGTKTITITGANTIDNLYDYVKYWLTQNMNVSNFMSASGKTVDITDYQIVGLQHLTSGTKLTSIQSTGTITANDAFSIEVIGTVNQATPTNLVATAKATTLVYNTNTDTSVTYATGTQIGTVRNDGTAIVTIVGGSITDYTDAQINYLDSNITAVGITSATIYQTEANRDSGAAGATFTTSLNFKYGSVVSGVTMQNTVYLRVVVGSVTLFAQITLVLGSNTLDLGVQGQLSAINAKVDLTAKETTLLQTETDIIAEINANETKIDTLQTSVDNLPTLSEIEASTELAKESSVQLAIAVSV